MTGSPDVVLVVTEPMDPHADQVIRKLNDLEVPVFRLHTEEFPLGDVRVSVRPSADGLVGDVSAGGRTFRTTDLRAAWYRRPRPPWLRGTLPAGMVRFVSTQARATLAALWQAIPENRWVASPAALLRADVKALQLVHAARAGLAIPDTLITNDPARARGFRAGQAGGCCAAKALQVEVTNSADGYRTPFTAVWADDAIAEDRSIEMSPTIYQEYLEKLVELRCVVMGDEIYCAEMDTQSRPATRLDSRLDPDIPMRPHRLPPEVEAAVARLVASFGIRTASMDLVLRPDGRYVFLDLNPNGQWLWIEERAGLPLSDAMARLLLAA